MRKFFILILLIVVFSTNHAFADDDHLNIESIKDSIPSTWLEAFNENVGVMGENRAEFEKAFSSLDSEAKKRAAVFLIAFMPLVDLVAMDAETMVDNIDYAFKAREEYPWASGYDDATFYHYVLPHRVSQEPIQNFRPFFYNELKDRLDGLTTLDEAAVEVNKWCSERVGFKQTQRRDQGPFETLKSGYGRCEEMMIFYIDAARSVGIPARQAWTPYWAHCDNNHAWAEVWAREKWNFLGACEYAPELNQSWFARPAKRAALVMSVPFGLPDKENTVEEIYRYADYLPDRYAIINSTSFYAEPGSLEVTVVDENDEPMKEANVLVYVFNFGALRPIAKLVTDENGVAEITIGEGRFFVSGGNEKLGGGKLVKVKKNKTSKVTIKPKDGPVLDGNYWLRPAKDQK